VIRQARNSRELGEVLSLQSMGSSKCHAFPVAML
jgi:hypothetical protein